jgi:hypothetical protein
MLSPVGPGKLGARGTKRDKAGKRFKDGTRERYSEQLAWTVLTQKIRWHPSLLPFWS